MSPRDLYPYILGLLLSTFVTASAFAAVGGEACDYLFMSAEENRAQAISYIEFEAMNFPAAGVATLSAKAISPDQNRIELLENASRWRSTARATEDNEDPQSDSRLVFVSFLPYTLSHFSFALETERSMLLPSVEAYNRKIRKLNVELYKAGRNPISIRYYEDEIKSQDQYINSYRGSRRLPMAKVSTKSAQYIHDVSYHAAAILVPGEYYDSLDQVLDRLTLFKNWLEKKRPLMVASIDKHIAELIDMTNGNIPIHLISAHFDNGLGAYSGLSKGTRHNVDEAAELFTKVNFPYDESIEIQYKAFLKEMSLKDLDFGNLSSGEHFYTRLLERRFEIEEAAWRLSQ